MNIIICVMNTIIIFYEYHCCNNELFIIVFSLPFLGYKWEFDSDNAPECVFRIDTAPHAVTQFSISHPRRYIFPWTVTYYICDRPREKGHIRAMYTLRVWR